MYRGSSARFTNRKNTVSQITDIKISFSQKINPLASGKFKLVSILAHAFKKSISLNPLLPGSDRLIDFTLSNAIRFYSSKGDPLGLKELKNYLP